MNFQRWATAASRVLNDGVMGLLALLTVLATALPFVYSMSPTLQVALIAWDVLVILVFSLEYLAGLVLSGNAAGYARDPWRVLDAFIILATILSLLPLPTEALGATPALRLIRFARIAVLGTRSSTRLSGAAAMATGTSLPAAAPLTARALDHAARPLAFREIGWDQLLERIGTGEDDWLYVSGIADAHLTPLADRLNVPAPVLHSKLFESTIPRIDRLERFVTLFCWYPQLLEERGAESPRIERTGVLVVGSEHDVAVIVQNDCHLLEHIEAELRESNFDTPPLVNATYALMRVVVRAYTKMVEHLETQLARIEAADTTLRDEGFLQLTFSLRSDIARVRTNLRHLVNVTQALNSRHIAIRGFETELPQFQMLIGAATDTFERVDDLAENLTAIVDMRLNISSFQMNRVMRLLAILTTLALIPAVAGGMLGMNLQDSPWAVPLSQVAFWVGSGMALSLYLFSIKGWLR